MVLRNHWRPYSLMELNHPLLFLGMILVCKYGKHLYKGDDLL